MSMILCDVFSFGINFLFHISLLHVNTTAFFLFTLAPPPLLFNDTPLPAQDDNLNKLLFQSTFFFVFRKMR